MSEIPTRRRFGQPRNTGASKTTTGKVSGVRKIHKQNSERPGISFYCTQLLVNVLSEALTNQQCLLITPDSPLVLGGSTWEGFGWQHKGTASRNVYRVVFEFYKLRKRFPRCCLLEPVLRSSKTAKMSGFAHNGKFRQKKL